MPAFIPCFLLLLWYSFNVWFSIGEGKARAHHPLTMFLFNFFFYFPKVFRSSVSDKREYDFGQKSHFQNFNCPTLKLFLQFFILFHAWKKKQRLTNQWKFFKLFIFLKETLKISSPTHHVPASKKLNTPDISLSSVEGVHALYLRHFIFRKRKET